MKSLSRFENSREMINHLIKRNASFIAEISNYTTSIVMPDSSFKFMRNMQSKRCFAAFAKIKHDLKNIPPPDILPSDVIYFTHDIKKEMFEKQIFSIDLKSAYATILYNDGFISETTYQYISKLPKGDRLASVGMLASNKNIYEFKNGMSTLVKNVRSPYSGFFFYAVQRTFEIMHDLRTIIQSGYLFTWVDCIYFLCDEEKMSECLFHLENKNFKATPEFLKDFTVTKKPGHIKIEYYKEGKYKILKIPSNRSGAKVSEIELKVVSQIKQKSFSNFKNKKQ